MEHQNWNYVVLEKKQKKQGQKEVNKAEQSGQEVETIKKQEAPNKAQLDAKKVAKILNEEEYKVETVSHNFRIALQQARNAAGLTQEKLAQMVNEKNLLQQITKMVKLFQIIRLSLNQKQFLKLSYQETKRKKRNQVNNKKMMID
eukprot:TRINITY_DN3750_c0_g1_i2.p1 TRINITY_DN3750_c0_g1~~TRINITY_DN3750_c0_g1_i2.p1  ORF type:complete len:145 (+),score=32.15 TRINITY_DN3750_c0_g1_i2:61-495(+)